MLFANFTSLFRPPLPRKAAVLERLPVRLCRLSHSCFKCGAKSRASWLEGRLKDTREEKSSEVKRAICCRVVTCSAPRSKTRLETRCTKALPTWRLPQLLAAAPSAHSSHSLRGHWRSLGRRRGEQAAPLLRPSSAVSGWRSAVTRCHTVQMNGVSWNAS